jgi:hypothetical protein
MKRRLINLTGFALLGLTIGWLCGCTNWERQAFQALSASKAAIDSAQQAYEVSASTGTCPAPAPAAPSCIPHSAAAFAAINKAKGAQKTAVDSLVTYETAKANSQGQAALQVAQTDVEAALAALPVLIADVKHLYAGGK